MKSNGISRMIHHLDNKFHYFRFLGYGTNKNDVEKQ